MALPVDPIWRRADRYLMVRNPYTRYMSMYEYLRAPHNYTKFGAREIQGKTWGGLQRGRPSPYADREPMNFEEFLLWLVAARKEYGNGRWEKRRGPHTTPFAFRSPWVWLDSLVDSWHHLAAQPSEGEIRTGVVYLEHIWEHMAGLRSLYGLGTLSVRGTIRANRTLTYRDGGGAAYWGGVGCARSVFSHDGRFNARAVVFSVGCGCAACAVEVAAEAQFFSYA
jgi:hypothetical protein